MKKHIILSLLLSFIVVNAQKRIKSPYAAVDSITYKVGDEINIGFPSKSNEFQTIFLVDRDNALETTNKVLGILGGKKTAKSSPVVNASDAVKNYTGKINHFKQISLKNNATGMVAFIKYNSNNFLAIYLDAALVLGEVISKNKNFITEKDSGSNSSNNYLVTPFNNNFEIEIVSVVGDKQNQTVTVEYTIQHALVNQTICSNCRNYYYDSQDSFATDFDGNSYDIKDNFIGIKNSYAKSGKIEVKVPTNIKTKGGITFRNILPNIEKLSYVELKMGNKNFDGGGSYNYGSTEFRNLPIEWK